MSFPKYDDRSRKPSHPYRGKPVYSATKPRKGVHAHHIEISFLGDAPATISDPSAAAVSVIGSGA